MKRIVFLLAFVFLALPLRAGENAFERKEDDLGQAKLLEKPNCSDDVFRSKILETAKNYLEKKPTLSSMARRQKTLKLKRLNAFEAVPVSGFSPEQDYNTANALLMIKINEHIEEENIVLCKQTNFDSTPVYIISYPYLDNYKVHIINLDPKNPNYDAVSFVYP